MCRWRIGVITLIIVQGTGSSRPAITVRILVRERAMSGSMNSFAMMEPRVERTSRNITLPRIEYLTYLFARIWISLPRLTLSSSMTANRSELISSSVRGLPVMPAFSKVSRIQIANGSSTSWSPRFSNSTILIVTMETFGSKRFTTPNQMIDSSLWTPLGCACLTERSRFRMQSGKRVLCTKIYLRPCAETCMTRLRCFGSWPTLNGWMKIRIAQFQTGHPRSIEIRLSWVIGKRKEHCNMTFWRWALHLSMIVPMDTILWRKFVRHSGMQGSREILISTF